MNERELFDGLSLSSQSLEGAINAETQNEFVGQFRAIFSCPLAKTIRGVVYLWATQAAIPRMKGYSSIVYIGKTTASLYDRHYRYAKLEGSEMNWERYRYIIRKYGPITVKIAQCDDPREIERKLLTSYYKEHLELPPINACL